MAGSLRVAAVQMSSGSDPEANLATAIALIDRAARAGAEVVSLPEVWNFMGPLTAAHAAATSIPGPVTDALAATARAHGIVIHGGSVYARDAASGALRNTSVLIDRDGTLVAQYSKIHLFDVDFAGQLAFHESVAVEPGNEIVTGTVADVAVGLSICYDLRFPELFRILALRGAQLVFLPAAFTLHTGKDHWEALIRARAIENQCFMVAAAQYGQHPDGSTSYGRSMIVDPWGIVLAQAADGPGLAIADLDFAMLERVRRELPSLHNRRPQIYTWPEPKGAPV